MPEHHGSTGPMSARSTVSGAGETAGRKKKKATKTPVTIEQAFNTPSHMTSADLAPPAARVVLTPRSAEVTLKLGVNPETIKIRDIDSFWEPGLDPAVQRMRHEAYVQRRHDLMKQCRLERKKLLNAEFEQEDEGKNVGMTPEQLLDEQKAKNSTVVETEMKRIEKMKLRQEKELEQMLQYEINRAKQQQDMEQRIQVGRKKEEVRKKQQEKRLKLMAEERRLRELQKVAQEEAEEEKSRQMSKSMYDREQEIIAEQKRRNEETARQLQEQEVEKRRKHQEHKMQVQQFFADQQTELRARLAELHHADKKKQDMILARQTEHKKKLQKKKEIVSQRIERNMQLASDVEEKRKNDFLAAQAKSEALREEHMRKQDEERELKQQEIMLQEQRKRMILLQQMRLEEEKKAEMLNKFEEEEYHVEEVFAHREHEYGLVREKKKLNLQMKKDNVERVQRMQEYKRLNTLKKIEAVDDRTKNMVATRKDLIKQRRETAIKTRLQKDQINKVMEQVRTDAAKANKIIKMVMSGQGTISSLTADMTNGSSDSPKKGSSGRAKTASTLLNSKDSRQSKSATASGFERSGGPTYSAASGDGGDAQAYVSPYVAAPADDV
jgi:hypothetical protein